MSHAFHHVSTAEGETLSVFLADGPLVLDSSHPNFSDVLDGARVEIPSDDLRALADLSVAVSRKFEPLSERVSVANGKVYFDGDAIDNSLSRQIRRCLDESVGDWRPLVRFLENVSANPQAHSREQLYGWLADRDFTINDDGTFVGYKGVEKDGSGGFQSGFQGTAIVDGVEHVGKIPTNPGSVIEMPRSSVAFDPAMGCSTGLHVGTFDYAKAYARGALLRVHVNPRDVVSVPTDSGQQKMRVCRYQIVEIIDAPETAPVAFSEREERAEDDGYDYCEECDERLDSVGECWNEDCIAY